MMDKPAHEIQDSFLNTARKEKVTVNIYLVSGVKLTGRIRSFDRYCVILESGNQEQMIFKHAISTLVLPRPQRDAPPRDFLRRRAPGDTGQPRVADEAVPAADSSTS